MFKYTFAIAWLLVLFAFSSHAQTVKEFQARYGKPVEVYEIRPGILIYPKFDSDGRLIEARIQRAIATESTVYLDPQLPNDQLKEILSDLVPLERRGKKTDFPNLLVTIGAGGTQIQDYENVSFTYYSSMAGSCSGLMALVVNWKPSFYQSK